MVSSGMFIENEGMNFVFAGSLVENRLPMGLQQRCFGFG